MAGWDIQRSIDRVQVGRTQTSTQLTVQETRVAQAKKRQPNVSDAHGVVDPELDLIWSKGAKDSRINSNYFDYYFSGQDIQIYIDGTDHTLGFNQQMPIVTFAWNIQQQKMPLYGAWSYAYDALAYGVRIVSGMFHITTTSTDYMMNMLSQAAKARADRPGSLTPMARLDRDEENIERYWERNLDPTTQIFGNRHIFSAHPPFNFIIKYGMQDTSVVDKWEDRNNEVFYKYAEDTVLYTDVNERLVPAGASGAMRYVLENVSLTGLQIEYDPSGTPLGETYSFIARDVRSYA